MAEPPVGDPPYGGGPTERSDGSEGSRWGPRGTIARRELGALSREKTIVLALVIQLFVAAFSSFLVVGLAAMYDPSGITGEVDVGVTGDAAEELVDAAETQGVRAVPYPDAESALAAFDGGQVAALVEAERAGGRIAITATVPENSLRRTLVVARLQATLEALERAERVERADFLSTRPLPLPPGTDGSPYFGFTYTVLLPLLVFMPAFVSGSIAVDAVTEEIEQGTLELLRVAPVTLVDIVDGKGIVMAALVPVQVALWLGLLAFNGIAVANALLLVVLATGFGVGLVALGVGLGFILPTRERAQLLYSLAVLSLFAAGSLLPEHPVNTAARLAIDSPGPFTAPLVVGYAVAGLALAVVVRALVARVEPESLWR